MIKFIDRFTAKKLIKQGYFNDNKSVIISISDNEKERNEMQSLYNNQSTAIFLAFKDIDSGESGLTKDDCKKVIELAQYAVDNNLKIIVHCFAGVSRSGAVAKWINDYLAKRQEQYLTDYKGYNRYVYQMLESAYGVSMKDYYEGLEDAVKRA